VDDIEADVVVVGSGISGGIVARYLAERGTRVVVLEAGPAYGRTWADYQSHVDTYLTALAKVPNAPYPNSPGAPAPNVLDLRQINDGPPDTSGYFVQLGPLPYGTDYLRGRGGTTLHWFAHSIRMVPNDFQLASLYGVGVDWPIGYTDLESDYIRAEREIGVAADVDDQRIHGVTFPPGYVYPMKRIPPSYVDQVFMEAVNGNTTRYGGIEAPLDVVSLPQGRNGMPNDKYDGGAGYTAVGAVGAGDQGLRCQGNSSCIPICPVQAKYSALKTVHAAERHGARVITQAVASSVEVDPAGRVTGIKVKRWTGDTQPAFTSFTVRARIYVIAAGAIETAKLLLSSGLKHNRHVGAYLMDHPFVLTTAMMDRNIGAFRGPGSTSGLESLRDGAFRSRLAAVRADVSNWGWNIEGSPQTDVISALEHGLFGPQMRTRLATTVPRQVQLGFLLEQLPDESNRVTVNDGYRDAIGEHRPVIHYDLDDYVKEALPAVFEVAKQVYSLIGAQDCGNNPNKESPGYLTYKGQGYTYMGAGHGVGTHRMGSGPHDSVVDPDQRCWDHPNLFLAGGGSMPTIGTSNPTLTLAALAFRTVDRILKELGAR
jgi:choline dehydrogenase-like flavoprotein